MHYEQVFDLLTKEYSFILATTIEDFEAVKVVRSDVFEHRYSIYPELKNAQWYLFSEDDEQSFIYLLRHNASNTYIGTVSIFFINERTPIKALPMQKSEHVKDITRYTKTYPLVEISRGALIHNLPPHETYSALKLRTMLTYGLMVSTRINFFLYHCTNVFSIMERPLHHILSRQQVNFRQIGEEIDYYGKRTPYATDRGTLLHDTEETMGKITNYYLKQLCENPEPFWEFIDNNPYLERSDIHLDEICKLFEEFGDDADLTLLLDEEGSQPLATMA